MFMHYSKGYVVGGEGKFFPEQSCLVGVVCTPHPAQHQQGGGRFKINQICILCHKQLMQIRILGAQILGHMFISEFCISERVVNCVYIESVIKFMRKNCLF
eukprot:TRINITY_DN33237_c0_g1_i1.p3 TRINITY_DN33237_c0_g1~~TRINITY_DN33237_c0_g1_i1.p3  ORF type:complete len:101 (+),score=11.21 TRINITY_DN33237_c0_g1_i1:219-521(+)